MLAAGPGRRSTIAGTAGVAATVAAAITAVAVVVQRRKESRQVLSAQLWHFLGYCAGARLPVRFRRKNAPRYSGSSLINFN